MQVAATYNIDPPEGKFFLEKSLRYPDSDSDSDSWVRGKPPHGSAALQELEELIRRPRARLRIQRACGRWVPQE